MCLCVWRGGVYAVRGVREQGELGWVESNWVHLPFLFCCVVLAFSLFQDWNICKPWTRWLSLLAYSGADVKACSLSSVRLIELCVPSELGGQNFRVLRWQCQLERHDILAMRLKLHYYTQLFKSANMTDLSAYYPSMVIVPPLVNWTNSVK